MTIISPELLRRVRTGLIHQALFNSWLSVLGVVEACLYSVLFLEPEDW